MVNSDNSAVLIIIEIKLYKNWVHVVNVEYGFPIRR